MALRVELGTRHALGSCYLDQLVQQVTDGIPVGRMQLRFPVIRSHPSLLNKTFRGSGTLRVQIFSCLFTDMDESLVS